MTKIQASYSIYSAVFLILIELSGILASQYETTTIADQYDSIIAYDAPDGQVLYYYETRKSGTCSPIPEWGSGGRPFGVGYHYFFDSPVIWAIRVDGSYECADECYRSDCKEFKIVQQFQAKKRKRHLMTCLLLWKGCFSGPVEAPVVADAKDGKSRATGEVIKFTDRRVYKPNALYTYFTKDTTTYCGGPYSGDLFSGGISAFNTESCASLCMFYSTKICSAFGFDSKANRCYLKTVDCSSSRSVYSKINAENQGERNDQKLEFYVRKPWLSSKYEHQDLIRFDQTMCTATLPNPATNFTSPDEPANICRKDSNCTGFQCFQYCREKNMPKPWECGEWDPDNEQYECSFILKSSPCRSGYNTAPARRSFLFVKHNFKYSRPFIAPEFYSRMRRSTTPRPRILRADVELGKVDKRLLKQLKRIRKAYRIRRLHRLAMGWRAGDRHLRRRLRRLRRIIRARFRQKAENSS